MKRRSPLIEMFCIIFVVGCGESESPENSSAPAPTPKIVESEPEVKVESVKGTVNSSIPPKPIDFEAPDDLPLPTTYHVDNSYQLDLNVGHKIAVLGQVLDVNNLDDCKTNFEQIFANKGWSISDEIITKNIMMMNIKKEKDSGVIRILTKSDVPGVFFQLEVIYAKQE